MSAGYEEGWRCPICNRHELEQQIKLLEQQLKTLEETNWSLKVQNDVYKTVMREVEEEQTKVIQQLREILEAANAK